ncbi:MAG: caspase family protein, partial [Microcystis sp.]
HKLALPSDNILKLIASQDNFTNPNESSDQLPTYENIIANFHQLANMAQQGDSVYIHYSGHGGRATTLYPEVKGKYGIDEVLVPTNIGDPNTRYIRDIELAFLLEVLVSRQLIVTLVLDCCHSGGATRGNQTEVRGINAIDTTIRSSESLVASRNELISTWQKLSLKPTRHVAANGGILPVAKGYVLLAACRPSESAYEYAFEGNRHNGVLSYWLFKFLDHPNPELTYKVLYDYLLAKINSHFSKQTPMLLGEGTRLVFGYEKRPIHQAVTIMEVKEEQQQIKINGGQVHGLVQGSQLAVYPSGT